MSCSNINNELACKPFAPMTNNPSPDVYGPPGSLCNKRAIKQRNSCENYFSDQCAHFRDLMHGLKRPNPCVCYNGYNREYICPNVGGNSPRGRDCFNQPPSNLGANTVCYNDSLPGQNQKYGTRHNQNQTGGAFTAYPSTLNVGVDDPDYFACETVVHLKPSYLEGPVYGNLADSCGLRTNYRPSKQPGLDVSLVRSTGPQTGPKMETSLCGDRQRCGNGACAPTQNPSLNQCKTGCQKLNLPRACSWDDRVLTSPWVYGQGTADIPTWYFDLSQDTVGARPQYRAGTNNSVPPMMLINQTNLLGAQFGCRQPCWQSNCL